ncbi:MAG: asparagine synthase (glutamine-hydrolyzing) [Candidatus Auribacterota bacterium]|nr:asparagine synthase (glutamine-hydrolyzing) [Candidatus Auribacterota bacterium]
MCGICGIYRRGEREIDPRRIISMRDIMIPRGPDDAGLYIAPHIGLGFRRLSIIDLSSAGNQPMSNAEGSLHLLFNGEIYNFQILRDQLISKGHRFQSRTDTEILIHGYEEWGLEGMLDRLNGMFAFAIWDRKGKKLILARDRTGEKPLFYLEKDGDVYFSSDIKSIWAGYEGELSIDRRAIDAFLYFNCIPQEYTIYQQVRKLPPAHYIVFSANDSTCHPYWSLSFANQTDQSEGEILEEIKERLTRAVRIRMTSDVPLGAFLSGGIDSSLVVALMAMHSDQPIKTFSIGFKEQSHDELPFARMVAKKYGTDHHEFIVETDALAIMPDIIWNYGEPFADVSQIPTYYVAKITREFVTVALTGDGGDESFGGYNNISAQYYGMLYRKYLPALLGDRLIPRTLEKMEKLLGKRQLLKRMMTLARYGGRNFINSLDKGYSFSLSQREQLYSDQFKEELAGHNPHNIYREYIDRFDGKNAVDLALYIDIKTQLPNEYLTKVDVATMMNSLETRAPFLDHRLMEYAARIPANKKVKGGEQKYLLKKLAADFIPRKAVYRPKQGFNPPLDHWLRNIFASKIKELLLSKRSVARKYFKYDYIESLIEEHLGGRADHSDRIWALLCLELWHLIFVDGVLQRNDDLLKLNL